MVLIANSLIICQTGVASRSFSQNSSRWNLSPTLLIVLFVEVHQLFLLKERKKGSDESTQSQHAEAYSAAPTRLFSMVSTCAKHISMIAQHLCRDFYQINNWFMLEWLYILKKTSFWKYCISYWDLGRSYIQRGAKDLSRSLSKFQIFVIQSFSHLALL